MNRRRITLVLATAFLLLCLWWLIRAPQQEPTGQSSATTSTPSESNAAEAQTSPTPPEQAAQLKEAADLVEKIFASPIDFYGRVVDQNGNPVPFADVGYTAADKFNASGTNYTGQADAQGYFQITGIQGAALAVAVRKAGYYFLNETDKSSPSSAATFGYSMGPDSYRRVPPTKENPAVFVLHKMGETVPLILVENRSFRIPRDGTPVMVDLLTGKESASGQLQVEAWTSDKLQDGTRFHDWKCRVSIIGGGLIERTEQFDFIAPAEGYEPFDEVAYSRDDRPWNHRFSKEYFVRFADNSYGRIKFWFTTGGTHFFEVESLINPAPGDRNLEFDPKKAIKP